MDNFILSANVVLPLFLTMMLGYGMKRMNWFDDVFLKHWNRIFLQFSSIRHHWRPLLLGVSGKLLLVPLLFLPISIGLGFQNAELLVLTTLFGAPTAVSSYTMAQQMGADDELAGQIVVFTAVFSIITMFLWIFLGRSWGFFV